VSSICSETIYQPALGRCMRVLLDCSDGFLTRELSKAPQNRREALPPSSNTACNLDMMGSAREAGEGASETTHILHHGVVY
jgi:hypothetical protein